LALNPDASILLTGSYDKTVKCWDLKGHGEIQTLSDFKDSVTSIVLHEDQIIAGSVDGRLRTYDVRMGKLTTDHIMQPITSVRLSNDANCLLLSCMDDSVRLLDKASGEVLNEYKGHSNSTYRIESCLTNDDAYVICGSEDNQVYIWSLVEGRVVHTLKGHTKVVTSVCYHPKETCLLTASTDGTTKVWK